MEYGLKLCPVLSLCQLLNKEEKENKKQFKTLYCEAAPEMGEIGNTLPYVSTSKREFNGFDIQKTKEYIRNMYVQNTIV